jgi:hypothetical protein
MVAAFVLVIGATAVANIAAAIADFLRAPWILDNMTGYGVPRSWLFGLGALKALGGIGLLVGFAVPLIGTAAALGLVVYFIGAVSAVVRARAYSHIPYPAAFLLLAAGSLAVALVGS